MRWQAASPVAILFWRARPAKALQGRPSETGTPAISRMCLTVGRSGKHEA